MHTLVLRVPGFLDVRIHHNPDWSGIATIATTKKGEAQQEIHVPGAIFKELQERSLQYFKDSLGDLCAQAGLEIKGE